LFVADPIERHPSKGNLVSAFEQAADRSIGESGEHGIAEGARLEVSPSFMGRKK